MSTSKHPKPVEVVSNPTGPGSVYDRHRQIPPTCFEVNSFRTVPLDHTTYPKKGRYNVAGAKAVVGRLRKTCAKKWADRGVRVKHRAWAIQSILTPKSAGIKTTPAEYALDKPYGMKNPNVKEPGVRFHEMTRHVLKKFGASKNPKEYLKAVSNPEVVSNPKKKPVFDRTTPEAKEMFKTEKAEHPSLPDKTIWVIVKDHLIAHTATRATESSEHQEYTKEDFEIVPQDFPDRRIAYVIRSKDGEIEANVFWEEGKFVEVRGMVGEDGTLQINYLYKAHGTPKPASEFIRGITMRVNDMHFHKKPLPPSEPGPVLGPVMMNPAKNPVQAKFDINQSVYVPSTKDGNKPISAEEMSARVEETKKFLSEQFGGYTSVSTEGGYYSSAKKAVIKEKVVKITSFTTKAVYEIKKATLQDWLHTKAKMWGQESIGYEVEGDLLYVNPTKNPPVEFNGPHDNPDYVPGDRWY